METIPFEEFKYRYENQPIARLVTELELNAIQTALTLKMVSFHLVDNLRKNLPKPFSTMKPESVYQHFIKGVQGKVQLKRDKQQVDTTAFSTAMWSLPYSWHWSKS